MSVQRENERQSPGEEIKKKRLNSLRGGVIAIFRVHFQHAIVLRLATGFDVDEILHKLIRLGGHENYKRPQHACTGINVPKSFPAFSFELTVHKCKFDCGRSLAYSQSQCYWRSIRQSVEAMFHTAAYHINQKVPQKRYFYNAVQAQNQASLARENRIRQQHVSDPKLKVSSL